MHKVVGPGLTSPVTAAKRPIALAFGVGANPDFKARCGKE